MPAFFNSFIDRFQQRAFRKLTASLRIDSGVALDLGTGIGRWLSQLQRMGASRVIGVDLERLRLDIARDRPAAKADLIQMSVETLALQTGTVDLVNCVTVLQHLPDETKRTAIREVSRVLRPGGWFILFELIATTDQAAHVFPWPAARWIEECELAGMTLDRAVGDQFLPLFRLPGVFRPEWMIGGSSADTFVGSVAGDRRPALKFVRLRLLRAATLASYPLEYAAAFLLPPRAARINGFLFTKAR
jgi:SAM-dependent methyltransferase